MNFFRLKSRSFLITLSASSKSYATGPDITILYLVMDLCKPLIMKSNKFIKAAKMYHISEKLKHGPMDLEGVNSAFCSVKACIH